MSRRSSRRISLPGTEENDNPVPSTSKGPKNPLLKQVMLKTSVSEMNTTAEGSRKALNEFRKFEETPRTLLNRWTQDLKDASVDLAVSPDTMFSQEIERQSQKELQKNAQEQSQGKSQSKVVPIDEDISESIGFETVESFDESDLRPKKGILERKNPKRFRLRSPPPKPEIERTDTSEHLSESDSSDSDHEISKLREKVEKQKNAIVKRAVVKKSKVAELSNSQSDSVGSSFMDEKLIGTKPILKRRNERKLIRQDWNDSSDDTEDISEDFEVFLKPQPSKLTRKKTGIKNFNLTKSSDEAPSIGEEQNQNRSSFLRGKSSNKTRDQEMDNTNESHDNSDRQENNLSLGPLDSGPPDGATNRSSHLRRSVQKTPNKNANSLQQCSGSDQGIEMEDQTLEDSPILDVELKNKSGLLRRSQRKTPNTSKPLTEDQDEEEPLDAPETEKSKRMSEMNNTSDQARIEKVSPKEASQSKTPTTAENIDKNRKSIKNTPDQITFERSNTEGRSVNVTDKTDTPKTVDSTSNKRRSIKNTPAQISEEPVEKTDTTASLANTSNRRRSIKNTTAQQVEENDTPVSLASTSNKRQSIKNTTDQQVEENDTLLSLANTSNRRRSIKNTTAQQVEENDTPLSVANTSNKRQSIKNTTAQQVEENDTPLSLANTSNKRRGIRNTTAQQVEENDTPLSLASTSNKRQSIKNTTAQQVEENDTPLSLANTSNKRRGIRNTTNQKVEEKDTLTPLANTSSRRQSTRNATDEVTTERSQNKGTPAAKTNEQTSLEKLVNKTRLEVSIEKMSLTEKTKTHKTNSPNKNNLEPSQNDAAGTSKSSLNKTNKEENLSRRFDDSAKSSRFKRTLTPNSTSAKQSGKKLQPSANQMEMEPDSVGEENEVENGIIQKNDPIKKGMSAAVDPDNESSPVSRLEKGRDKTGSGKNRVDRSTDLKHVSEMKGSSRKRLSYTLNDIDAQGEASSSSNQVAQNDEKSQTRNSSTLNKSKRNNETTAKNTSVSAESNLLRRSLRNATTPNPNPQVGLATDAEKSVAPPEREMSNKQQSSAARETENVIDDPNIDTDSNKAKDVTQNKTYVIPRKSLDHLSQNSDRGQGNISGIDSFDTLNIVQKRSSLLQKELKRKNSEGGNNKLDELQNTQNIDSVNETNNSDLMPDFAGPSLAQKILKRRNLRGASGPHVSFSPDVVNLEGHELDRNSSVGHADANYDDVSGPSNSKKSKRSSDLKSGNLGEIEDMEVNEDVGAEDENPPEEFRRLRRTIDVGLPDLPGDSPVSTRRFAGRSGEQRQISPEPNKRESSGRPFDNSLGLGSPIEAVGRLKHRLFTPRVPRLMPLIEQGGASGSGAKRPSLIESDDGDDLDSDVLAILEESDDLRGKKIEVKNKKLPAKKPKRTRKTNNNLDSDEQNFISKSDAVFLFKRFSGLRVAKEAEPALMEAVEKFNEISFRRLKTILVEAERHTVGLVDIKQLMVEAGFVPEENPKCKNLRLYLSIDDVATNEISDCLIPNHGRCVLAKDAWDTIPSESDSEVYSFDDSGPTRSQMKKKKLPMLGKKRRRKPKKKVVVEN